MLSALQKKLLYNSKKRLTFQQNTVMVIAQFH